MDKSVVELRELCLNSLYFFSKAVLGWDWVVPHVHGKLGDFVSDPEDTRLQVTLPRGFLKTTFLSISYALWRALPPRNEFADAGLKDPLHDPNVRILIVQNTKDNARKRLNVIRTHVEQNELLQELFPEIIPDSFHGNNRWSDTHAEIKRTESHPEATWETAGVGTSLVSRHYSEIIEDDIIAPKKDDLAEAIPTREDVEKAIGFHKSAISLLANPKDGRIINIGTRWAKYDVIQYIIDEQTPPFKRFELSAIEDGKATYPERFDLETLANIRNEQGTYIFSSQYLNKPFDSEKMVFRPEWITKYEVEPPRDTMKVYVGVDPAIGQKKDNDYSIVMAAGITPRRELLVLDYERRRMTPTELIEKIFEYNEYYQPELVIIESVAWQQALAHFVEQEAIDRLTYIPIEEFKPSNKKETRIRGLQPVAQARKLKIKPYHTELEKELRDFPYSQYDDLSDTLASIKIHADFPAEIGGGQEETNRFLKEILAELRRGDTVGNLPFKDKTLV